MDHGWRSGPVRLGGNSTTRRGHNHFLGFLAGSMRLASVAEIARASRFLALVDALSHPQPPSSDAGDRNSRAARNPARAHESPGARAIQGWPTILHSLPWRARILGMRCAGVLLA